MVLGAAALMALQAQLQVWRLSKKAFPAFVCFVLIFIPLAFTFYQPVFPCWCPGVQGLVQFLQDLSLFTHDSRAVSPWVQELCLQQEELKLVMQPSRAVSQGASLRCCFPSGCWWQPAALGCFLYLYITAFSKMHWCVAWAKPYSNAKERTALCFPKIKQIWNSEMHFASICLYQGSCSSYGFLPK